MLNPTCMILDAMSQHYICNTTKQSRTRTNETKRDETKRIDDLPDTDM